MTTPRPASRGFIARLTLAAVSRPWLFVLGAALVSVVSIQAASGLDIRSNFEELLPADVPSVAHVKELVRRVGGDGSILVVVEAKDHAGLAAAKALAPRLAQEILALGPAKIRSVQWTMSEVVAWFSDHWPLFASVEELTQARDALRREVSDRKSKANPLFVDLDDEADAPAASAPQARPAPESKLQEWLHDDQKLPRAQVAARFQQFEDGFLVDPASKRKLTLNVRPAGTSLGVKEAHALLDELEGVVQRHQAELDQGGLRVGYGGATVTFLGEYQAITGDVFGTAVLCFSLVILSILLFFRDLRSTSSLGLAILIAVAATFGLTRLAIGYLNTQTAFLGVIVAGNGINYGLIYLACVQQLRKKGTGLADACVEGARTTAQATLLASATTSVSFGVLIIAANRGFRHFGFIGGVGMLLCWLATFLLVPAFLSLWERAFPFKLKGEPAPAVQHVPAFVARAFARPQAIVAGFAVLTLLAGAVFLHHLPQAMERNLENLGNDPIQQNKQLAEDNHAGQNSLGKSIAGTLALLELREEADLFCDAMRERMKEPPRFANAPPNSELIDGCETVSAIVPRFQPQKLALIGELRAELTESLFKRLQPAEARRLRSIQRDLDAQRALTIDGAPKNLLDPFRERDGTVGRLAVVTAKPLAKLELGPNLKAFVAAMRAVPVNGRLVDAAGGNVIFSDLLENIDREGPRTTLLSFLGVFALVLLYFRNWRVSSEIVVALVVGVVLMGGVAAAFDLKINFFNFIVYPVTFGIAVDYGANVGARVRERGGKVLESLVEVGPAVALCSWTTLIGYGSLLLSLNRALRSFGWYGMIGEVTTLGTALVLLPALMLRKSKAAVVP